MNYLLQGILVFLQQFPETLTHCYFGLIGQYVRSALNFGLIDKKEQINMSTLFDVVNHVKFFEMLIRKSGLSLEVVPPFVFLSGFSFGNCVLNAVLLIFDLFEELFPSGTVC